MRVVRVCLECGARVHLEAKQCFACLGDQLELVELEDADDYDADELGLDPEEDYDA